MSQLSEVYEGWKNLIFENEEVEKQAKERMRICVEECKKISIINCCQICGCYMPAKARSPRSTCPEGKWSTI